MAQLLVRNVDDQVVGFLKRRAATNGSSVEAEHRALLEESLRAELEAFKAQAKALRDQTRGRSVEESADLIREGREERMARLAP